MGVSSPGPRPGPRGTEIRLRADILGEENATGAQVHLLTASEVPQGPTDRVFSYPRGRAVIAAVSVLGGAAACGIAWMRTGSWLALYLGVLLCVALGIFRRLVTARFQPSNWLVRVAGGGVFVQFRSYLNAHLPVADRTVVWIPFDEIRVARRIREHRDVPDLEANGRPGGSVRETTDWVELSVRADTGALRQALDEERQRHPSGTALFRDYPVRVPRDGVVQVRWQVSPGLAAFLDAVRGRVAEGDPQVVDVDFTGLDRLPPVEQRQRIEYLVQQGEVIDAVALARSVYGLSTTQARALVDDIAARPSGTRW